MRVAVLLVVAAVLAFSPVAVAFETIPAGHWAAQAVENLHNEGVLIGYPDGTFRGANAATRYELAISLKRLENVVQGLATANAATKVAGVTTADTAAYDALAAEMAKVKELVDALAEAAKQDGKADARRDKALNDLTDSVIALQEADKGTETRLNDLQKALDDLKAKVGALDAAAVKAMIQAETAPLADRIGKLEAENSSLKSDLAQQKKSFQMIYWILGGVGLLAIAK
jgi:chromosome segregation ATPase